MLSRKNLAIAASLVFGLTYLFGCSSDDKPATSFYGSFSDSDFQRVQSEMSDIIDSTVNFIVTGFDVIAEIPTAEGGQDGDIQIQFGPGNGDSIIVSYSYANDWHILSFSNILNAYSLYFNDSIQFRNPNGVPEQNSDNIEELTYKHKWRSISTDTTVSHTDLSGSYDYIATGLSTTTALISGDITWNSSTKNVTQDSTVWIDIQASAALSSIEISRTALEWDQGCPSSGSMDISIQMTYTKDNNTPVVTEWSVTVTFSDGQITSMVSRGDITWSYNEQVCVVPFS